MCGPPALPTGYQIPYCLASNSPSTFTMVALESAYIFRLLAKMKLH